MFRYSTPCVTRSTFLLALPPLPSVHPSLVQLSRREGLSSCSWRHACLHCLRDTRVHAYVAPCMTMHLFFVVFFFFPRFIFTSFPPSFLCKYSARSYFCFSSPLPPLFPSSSPPPTLENKMRERCREGEVGRRGFQPLEPREPGRGEGEKGE